MSKFRSFLHSQDISEVQLWQKNQLCGAVWIWYPHRFQLQALAFRGQLQSGTFFGLSCWYKGQKKKGLINDVIDSMNYRKIDRLRRRKCCLHTMCLVPKIARVLLVPKSVYEYKHQSNGLSLEKTSRSNSYPKKCHVIGPSQTTRNSPHFQAIFYLHDLLFTSINTHKSPQCSHGSRERMTGLYKLIAFGISYWNFISGSYRKPCRTHSM